jgi:hypothetical protein
MKSERYLICDTAGTKLGTPPHISKRENVAMIHFLQDETDLVAIATVWNNPQAITRAKQSNELWVAIQFAIPGHGEAMIYVNRENFCKIADHVEGKQEEAVPHVDRWVREKLGLPSLSAWEISFSFTSQMPVGVGLQSPEAAQA